MASSPLPALRAALPFLLAPTLRLELVDQGPVAPDPATVDLAVGDPRDQRAAGLAIVAAVVEPAVRGQPVEILEHPM